MSLKRGILYTFLAQAPTVLLYFVSSTVMTRLLGDVGRGEYALINNQAILLPLLVGLNLNHGIVYFTSKEPERANKVVGVATSLLLVNLVLTPLLLWSWAGSEAITGILMPSGRTHWLYWGFIFLSIVLALINSSVSAVLLGLRRFNVLNVMGVLNAGLSALGFVLLAIFSDRVDRPDMLPTVLAVSATAMVLQTATWCVLYAVYVKRFPVPVWTWAVIRPMLTFSLLGYASNIINLINHRFDVWVVEDHRGPAELGLYAAAVGVAQLLFYVPDPFARVVQPFLFGQVKDEMLARFKAIARLNFTVLLVLAAGLAAVAHWAIPLLYGEIFAPSVIPLVLLLPGIVLSGSSKVLTQLVIQGGLQRFNVLATACAAVLTILLDLLLIPVWGIVGAAIATTIAYAATLLVLLITIRTRMGIPVHDLFLLRLSDLGHLRGRTP